MITDETKAVRREVLGHYKALATSPDQRDMRIALLEQYAMQLGWKPPAKAPDRNLPTFPFIFAWSKEQKLEVRPCHWAGGNRAVWQPHLPGVGRPLFLEGPPPEGAAVTKSAFHIVRSRKAVVKDLCAVCGEAVDTRGVRWFNIEEREAVRGNGWTDVRHPHFHLECIRHSLTGCPHLRAGFSGFAPYRGKIRKATYGLNGSDFFERYGLKVPHKSFIIDTVTYQIPSDEMVRLQSIAAGPRGFSYKEGGTLDG